MKNGIKKTILGLEREYWQAVRGRDADTVRRLTAERCVVVGPQGARQFGRDEVARMAESPEHAVGYEMDEKTAEVLPFGDEVAVATYRVRGPDGGEAYDSSVWVRQDGQWCCVSHTETPSQAA